MQEMADFYTTDFILKVLGVVHSFNVDYLSGCISQKKKKLSKCVSGY